MTPGEAFYRLGLIQQHVLQGYERCMCGAFASCVGFRDGEWPCCASCCTHDEDEHRSVLQVELDELRSLLTLPVSPSGLGAEADKGGAVFVQGGSRGVADLSGPVPASIEGAGAGPAEGLQLPSPSVLHPQETVGTPGLEGEGKVCPEIAEAMLTLGEIRDSLSRLETLGHQLFPLLGGRS